MMRNSTNISPILLLLVFAGIGLAQSFRVPLECYLDTGAVDIVFCMDTSMSMEPYIEDLQNDIVEFIDSIIARGYDFRLGAVPFDDSTNVWDFDPGTPGNQMTADTVEFNDWLADLDVSLVASDSWEVSLDAIFDALVDYEWREDALKIIIMFTNEGYHSTDDDTNLSDVSFEQVLDTVISHGAVVFIAASSRPPWVGSPIPSSHMTNFINLANFSGGYLDSLTADWTFILDHVVDLISTFTSVEALIMNSSGSSMFINAALEPLTPSCMSIRSENPIVSDAPVPNGGNFRTFWKVIVDTTCSDIDKCFDLRVWGGSVADTFYGCITDPSCFGYTDADIEHTPPVFGTTCLEVTPNPATLSVNIYNDGIRPITDVLVRFISSDEDLTIVGGDSNPRLFGEVGYLSSETVSWQLSVDPEGAGESHSYQIQFDYNEGTVSYDVHNFVVPELLTPPEVTISRGDTIICPGGSVMLEASITPSGTWSHGWTPVVGLDDPTALTPLASPLVTTTYTFTATDGVDCIDSDDITIVVTDTVFADAGPDTTVFPGRIVQLGGFPSGFGGYGSLSYEWSPNDGLSDYRSPNPVVYPYMSVEYILTVTDEAGCMSRDTVNINTQDPLGYILVQDETEILELR
ncbi:MAG: vWA domain-containing protein, partial [bacterium]